MKEVFDLIVIGSGPGGYVLALEAARRGLDTALIEERESLGGTCLNVGCIPSKALLESSELFYRITNEAAEHGINVSKAKADLKKMMSRKHEVVVKLTNGIMDLMKARGVTVFRGRGIVEAVGVVRVQTGAKAQRFKANKICLATGSQPIALPFLPFNGTSVVDSTDALTFEVPPAHLAIIGAGAIGLELGSVWARLGSKVTIIEVLPRILPEADAQVSRVLAASLKKQGLDIRIHTKVSAASLTSSQVNLTLEGNQGEKETFSVEKVLVAIGRRPVLTSALGKGLELALSPDGRSLAVDSRYCTSIPGIYAIGDLIPGPMLAHKAEDEGVALAALLAGEEPFPELGQIPGIVYTDPEAAWVGESEESLNKAGKPYEKGSFPFSANGRALSAARSEGFVKILTEPGDKRLLGVHMVGPHASELIAEAISVLAFGGSAEDIALTIHGHPTLSETLREAALAVLGRPLHRV